VRAVDGTQTLRTRQSSPPVPETENDCGHCSPGWSWQIVLCGRCRAHLGWIYRCTPEQFHGLIVAAVR